MIKSHFKVRSFIRVWMEAYFYMFIIYVLTLIFRINSFNLSEMVKSIFIGGSGYLNWFVTDYLIIYLLSPFFNIMILRLTKNQFQLLLMIFLVLALLQTVFHNPSIGTTGNDSVWLIVVYFFGAYVRLFQEDLKQFSNTIYLEILGGCMVLLISSVFVLNFMQIHFDFLITINSIVGFWKASACFSW